MTQYEKRFYDDIHSIAKSLEIIADKIKKENEVIIGNESLLYDYLTKEKDKD